MEEAPPQAPPKEHSESGRGFSEHAAPTCRGVTAFSYNEGI